MREGLGGRERGRGVWATLRTPYKGDGRPCFDLLTRERLKLEQYWSAVLPGHPLTAAIEAWSCTWESVVLIAPVWSRCVYTSQVDVQLNSTMRLISSTLHSTPLPWLPVLSNIELPALRRKAATDKLVEKIKHDSWPIQPDILIPPLLRLTFRKPLWLDLQPVDITYDGAITESRLKWAILT